MTTAAMLIMHTCTHLPYFGIVLGGLTITNQITSIIISRQSRHTAREKTAVLLLLHHRKMRPMRERRRTKSFLLLLVVAPVLF
jgi:hypothetical protein